LIAFAARQASESCQYIDLRSQSVEEVLGLLGIDAADSADAEEWRQQIADFPKKLGEDAWYPTLDKDACAECGKCLEFCPFGVYEMVDDRITVTFNARN
jgi:ferredoxin